MSLPILLKDGNFFISALLWTAPEILRDPMPPRNGTQKADIYGFAIILQEILYRCGPYEATGEMPMVPKGTCTQDRSVYCSNCQFISIECTVHLHFLI